MVEHNMFSAVEWAEKACDALIGAYSADELSAEYLIKDNKGRCWVVPGPGNEPSLDFFGARWRYNHGLFMVALQKLYEETGVEKYLDYTKQWADDRIDEEGNICVDVQMLDSIQPGLALFKLYKKYGDKKYKIAIENLKKSMDTLAKISEGVFSHTNKVPHEIWLDGLYMSEIFLMTYGENFGGNYFPDIAKHARILTQHTKDDLVGLLCHAYDESKSAEWANPVTGRSELFWGRAEGWYVFTLIDVLEKCPKDIPEYEEIRKMFLDQIMAIVKFQDEKTGLWYQLLDRGHEKGNWIETSCSCLFMYSIAKAVRLGLLDEKYLENVERCYRGLFDHVDYADEGFILYDVCQGTCVGNYPEFYYERGRVCNDYHGIGIFVLACIEYSKIKR